MKKEDRRRREKKSPKHHSLEIIGYIIEEPFHFDQFTFFMLVRHENPPTLYGSHTHTHTRSCSRCFVNKKSTHSTLIVYQKEIFMLLNVANTEVTTIGI